MEVVVGTCGFSGKGGRKNYFQKFSAVELQDTFYRVVPDETLRKWREEAPAGFEFTLKAFQGITHPKTSPTWRRAGGIKPTESHGFFKPTPEVFSGWEYTMRAASILRSRVVVFQTPPSFGPTEENLENLKAFFSKINRGDLILGWEPRGKWNEKPDLLAEVLKRYDLIHVVDPFRRLPLVVGKVLYFRLHGIGRGEVNYSYRYTEEDLGRLAMMIKQFESSRIYIFFNNINMFTDALEFKERFLSLA
ncbi:MAG: DUF72 domain-containing protein [Infirmifilum sp.]